MLLPVFLFLELSDLFSKLLQVFFLSFFSFLFLSYQLFAFSQALSISLFALAFFSQELFSFFSRFQLYIFIIFIVHTSFITTVFQKRHSFFIIQFSYQFIMAIKI